MVLTGGFTCGLTRVIPSQDGLSCETCAQKVLFWRNITKYSVLINQSKAILKNCVKQHSIFYLLSCHGYFLVIGLYSLYYIQKKTYNFSFLLFVLIWCWSGEIVVGQADFSSPPDQLSCKVLETFVNSVSGGGWGCLENYVLRIIVWYHKAWGMMKNGDHEGQIFLSHSHHSIPLLFLAHHSILRFYIEDLT